MAQGYTNASLLLDNMTKINHAWYTRDDLMSTLSRGMMKDQLVKDHERDENIAKMMTQLDLLTKHITSSGRKGFNVVTTSVDVDKLAFAAA